MAKQPKNKCSGYLCRRSRYPKKAEAAHTCPYRVEINDDKETLCDCCHDCTMECADDI